ncbi:NAD-dependent epimerase/dehydratase family protein [Vagococcus fluvialis]|uniref:NAD-dependent epimerase/dehydratase family protein n=1 Tax=Vagococcus fluvialis TaxID=2738 RepID=UPI003D0A1A9E
MKKILVTGAAGFIGFHLSKKLLNLGFFVMGVDNLNDYYDVSIKNKRLSILKENNYFCFKEVDISNKLMMEEVFSDHEFTYVINLAGQAGVRYSIENPYAYIESNIIGFFNILECCKQNKIEHLLYASSSSVYGGNQKIPFSTNNNVDHPVSFYAATKKSNELMAHSYSSLYKLPTTGMRFFTVYGEWGRPDMAYYKFANKMLKGESIDVYNNGEMSRDFTYIDDIIDAITKLMVIPPKENLNWNDNEIERSFATYRVVNIGNNKPEKLSDLISYLEDGLSSKAKINYMGMQKGDVKRTFADITDLKTIIDYEPKTELKDGISKFSKWYIKEGQYI